MIDLIRQATIREALASREMVTAAACYAGLRASLVEVDGLASDVLLCLCDRALDAATRYPGSLGGPVAYAENAVLMAYAEYLCTVVRERLDAAEGAAEVCLGGAGFCEACGVDMEAGMQCGGIT